MKARQLKNHRAIITSVGGGEIDPHFAQMAELADATAQGAVSNRSDGSIPSLRTQGIAWCGGIG